VLTDVAAPANFAITFCSACVRKIDFSSFFALAHMCICQKHSKHASRQHLSKERALVLQKCGRRIHTAKVASFSEPWAMPAMQTLPFHHHN